MFISELNEDVDAVARLLDIKMPTVRPASYARGKDVLQLISFFKADREPHFMTELMPDCTSMRWHPFFTDVIAGGVDKSVGIDKVLAYEGLSLDDAMAFGDGGNDVTMLSHVPYGIAMGNACDELKRVSAYVTDSVDEDGVEKALRHFGLIDRFFRKPCSSICRFAPLSLCPCTILIVWGHKSVKNRSFSSFLDRNNSYY